MSVSIKINWLDEADTNISLPKHETAQAAGADVRANLPPETRGAGITIPAGARTLIPTGFAMEIPAGFEVQVRPRSGLALKHGISLVNTPGTIDADYRGPVGILLINHGQEPYHIAHADRIAQFVVARVIQGAYQVSDQLGDTVRGTGGFGSTGTS